MMSNLKITDAVQVDLSSFTEADLDKLTKLIAFAETERNEDSKLDELLATFTSYSEFV